MPRIRTIKPEFPQSESMGRVSRDARLLFIQLWTLCDDHGRSRGDSRMLASLLYPYDADAGSLIDGWMAELEKEGCIARYLGEDGATYCASLNWEKHQRVDKPSKSKVPVPTEENIRAFSKNVREPPGKVRVNPETFLVGSRTKDQGRDQGPKDHLSAPRGAGEIVTKLSPQKTETDFELFWASYPRHTAKRAAERAFNSAVKRASLTKILAGAARYAAERKGEEERYTKHPATWLNGDCWADGASGEKSNGHAGDEWAMSEEDLLLAKIFGGIATDTLIFKRGKTVWPESVHGPAPNDPKTKIDPVVLSRHGYADASIYEQWKQKNSL